MTAFLFAISLLVYWGVVGFAVQTLFPSRLRSLQALLVSPAVGVAVLALSVFFLSRAGLPVKEFGRNLFAALAATALVVIAVKRPVFPFRRLLPYLGVLIVAAILVGRPMFSYGFDWTSFGNDDMANYCLAAQRFFENGFFDEPDLKAFFAGKDYSQAYWFMHVAGGVRSGSDLMLAAVWASSGWNAHQIFMPVMIALHLAMVCATAAMVGAGRNGKYASLIAASLMSLSPLATLGLLYQLIGQEGGLTLLCAAVTLLYRTQSLKFPKLILGSVPAVVVVSGILIWYPEILPFLGLGWVVYCLLLLRERGMSAVHRTLLPAVIVGAILVVVLNKYVLSALFFMLTQASGGMTGANPTNVLFPYFLVPSGIPALWGLIPIATELSDTFVSAAIVGALFISLWLLRSIARQLATRSAPAAVAAIMLLTSLVLFFRNNDFGLFKLAMFFQPFMITVVSVELSAMVRQRLLWRQRAAILAVLACCFVSQVSYVGRSTGELFGALNEIAHASRDKVNESFRTFFHSLRTRGRPILIDTSHVLLAKYQAFYTRLNVAVFPSRPFLYEFVDGVFRYVPAWKLDQFPEAEEYRAERNHHLVEHRFGANSFTVPKSLGELVASADIVTTDRTTVFNRFWVPPEETAYFREVSQKDVHLVFVHSDLGNHYYLGDVNKGVAFYQLENDPMFPGQTFSALGEHLLFMTPGSLTKARMVMEMTTTIMKQFNSELPNPLVQGSRIAFVGRGSARVVSEPFPLTDIDGVRYLQIDMSRKGMRFPKPPKGLMLLYGRDVPIDRRYITAFARDISLITEDDYKALRAPTSLRNFPADLANKNLEYSGFYEDGWISERAFVTLNSTVNSRYFMIKGTVPDLGAPDFKSSLRITLDGTTLAVREMGLGSFAIKVALPSIRPGRHRIDMTFDHYQRLPGEDGRPTGGKLEFVGYVDE
jgi:hypothetical protein